MLKKILPLMMKKTQKVNTIYIFYISLYFFFLSLLFIHLVSLLLWGYNTFFEYWMEEFHFLESEEMESLSFKLAFMISDDDENEEEQNCFTHSLYRNLEYVFWNGKKLPKDINEWKIKILILSDRYNSSADLLDGNQYIERIIFGNKFDHNTEVKEIFLNSYISYLS